MEKIKLEKKLIYHYSTYLDLTESKELKHFIQELLSKCEYQVLNFIEHHFSPMGYTCVWLLAESHLALHTFPESRTSYVELSSCSKEKNEKFKLLLENQYKF